MKKEIYDITIVGSGPAGLFAAVYGGLRQAKVKIIEALPKIGGQPGLLYKGMKIYDIAGLPGVTGEELINNLEKQISLFDIEVCTDEKAKEINRLTEDTIEIKTSKQEHYSKTVIIASGNGPFIPRKLGLEEEEQYEETTLHYYVDNIENFRDKKVAIFGGGDSAVDWSLELESIAEEVILVHRRNKFRALEANVDRLYDSSINIITPFTPKKLIGKNQNITGIVLQKVREEKEMKIKVDKILVNYGNMSSIGELKKWGYEMSGNSIVVNSKMETTIPGVYAIGDINTYEGKVNLIATGFGEAPTAVNNAMTYISKDQRLQPINSTSLFRE